MYYDICVCVEAVPVFWHTLQLPLNSYCSLSIVLYYTSCITTTYFDLFRPSSGIYNFLTFNFSSVLLMLPTLASVDKRESDSAFMFLCNAFNGLVISDCTCVLRLAQTIQGRGILHIILAD
jgi:hypothetical protein